MGLPFARSGLSAISDSICSRRWNLQRLRCSGLSAISDSICSDGLTQIVADEFRLERDLRFDMLLDADGLFPRVVPA